MAVIIICGPVDIHVSAVVWALENSGTRAIRWHPAPPWAAPGSISFDSASVDLGIPAKGGEINSCAIDAVWMRRWPKPVFPSTFGDSDKTAARNELMAYHRGLLELLPQSILWANPLAKRASANFKLRQLAAAVAVGLPIPRTVVTDDASRAKQFVTSNPEGEVIYKPFHSFRWERPDGKIYHNVTTRVAAADFDDPQALVWSPGIFQKFVPKAYELRVSMFGRTCVTAKITDQDPLDWRTRQSDMNVVAYELPDGVRRKLHALMDELGLVMGMADLIVTPEGEYVFLEVNEQGQFLWVEQMCPELPLLDIAARFFAAGDPHFEAEVVPGSGPNFATFLETGTPSYLEDEKAFREAGGDIDPSLLRDYDDDHADNVKKVRRE